MLQRLYAAALAISLTSAATGWCDIYRWDTGEVIPGTKACWLSFPLLSPVNRHCRLWGIHLAYADFSGTDLADAEFDDATLTGADFTRANLTDAYSYGATFTEANFTDAVVNGAHFSRSDLTAEQLYSTASYQEGDLRRIGFFGNDLTGWNFAGQNLTDASLRKATLTGVDFTEAVVKGADLSRSNLTAEQLYSTASYRQKDLSGVGFGTSVAGGRALNLTGWNFAGQNLTDADFTGVTLSLADFTDAVVKGTEFASTTGFTAEQLYRTANYQQGDLSEIGFGSTWVEGSGLNLTGWNFAGKNLDDARFFNATLTGADFTDAVVNGTHFERTPGFTAEQLYSTASYRQGDLRGMLLEGNNLTGWNFDGKNLTDAEFYGTNVTGADFTDAVVKGANFARTTGFSAEQLYSTASYQEKDLRGARLAGMDLTGWDFSGQDLTDVLFSIYDHPDMLYNSVLTDADLTDAVVTWTSFARCELTWHDWCGTGITKEQLYSTASYQEKDLRGIHLVGNDVTGWDFSGQDIRYARFFGVRGIDSAVFSSDTTYNQWTGFPEDFDPGSAGLTFVESPIGDFDGDNLLSLSDIETLSTRIRKPGDRMGSFSGYVEPSSDLNENYGMDQADLQIWVKDLKRTWFGDANLDGQFDSLDLTNLLQAGQYEDGAYENSSWSTGDWNADGEFDRHDLILALQDGGYGQGPRLALTAVPEPMAIVLAAMGFLGLAVIGWHRGGRRHTAS